MKRASALGRVFDLAVSVLRGTVAIDGPLHARGPNRAPRRHNLPFSEPEPTRFLVAQEFEPECALVEAVVGAAYRLDTCVADDAPDLFMVNVHQVIPLDLPIRLCALLGVVGGLIVRAEAACLLLVGSKPRVLHPAQFAPVRAVVSLCQLATTVEFNTRVSTFWVAVHLLLGLRTHTTVGDVHLAVSNR